jgi:hypothetical protein
MNNDPKLGALSALGVSSIRGFRIEKFAQAAKTFNHSSIEFAEFRVFFNQKLFTRSPLRLGRAISELGVAQEA